MKTLTPEKEDYCLLLSERDPTPWELTSEHAAAEKARHEAIERLELPMPGCYPSIATFFDLTQDEAAAWGDSQGEPTQRQKEEAR